MERPEASSHSGAEVALPRSARAIVAGRIVDMAGTSVLLKATDGRRALAMALLLCDLPSHPGPAHLKIRFSAECPPAPSRAPDLAESGFLLWREGADLAIRHGAGVGVRVRGGTAEVGGDDRELARAFRQIFPFAISHLLAPLGRYVLHAAGLDHSRGAVLVLGGSGAGKSSVLLAGTGAGWRPMSDDLVVVRPAARGPEARGIRRPVAVPPDMLDPAASDAQPIPGDPRGRWQVQLGPWTSGWRQVVGTLVSGHAATPESKLQPLTSGALLEPMLTSFLSLGSPDHLHAWFPLAAGLTRAPGWMFRHGRDPAQRRAGALRLLGVVGGHLTDGLE